MLPASPMLALSPIVAALAAVLATADPALVAALSHELRTPLTTIKGFSELIEMDAPSDDIRQFAGDIRQAADQLDGLISALLAPALTDTPPASAS